MRRSTALDLLAHVMPGFVFLTVLAFFGYMGKGSLFLVTISTFPILAVLTAVGIFLGFVLQHAYQAHFMRQDLPLLEAAEADALQRAIGEEAYARFIASKKEARYGAFVIESVLAKEAYASDKNRFQAVLNLAHAVGACITAILAATVFGMFLTVMWSESTAGIVSAALVATMWTIACLLLGGSYQNLIDSKRVMTAAFVHTHRAEWIHFLEGDATVQGQAKAVSETENGTFGSANSSKHGTLLKKAA